MFRPHSVLTPAPLVRPVGERRGGRGRERRGRRARVARGFETGGAVETLETGGARAGIRNRRRRREPAARSRGLGRRFGSPRVPIRVRRRERIGVVPAPRKRHGQVTRVGRVRDATRGRGISKRIRVWKRRRGSGRESRGRFRGKRLKRLPRPRRRDRRGSETRGRRRRRRRGGRLHGRRRSERRGSSQSRLSRRSAGRRRVGRGRRRAPPVDSDPPRVAIRTPHAGI